MEDISPEAALRTRSAPLEMRPEEFRRAGYQLVDRIATFLESLRRRPVTTGESPAAIRAALGTGPLPDQGAPADQLLEEAAGLLLDHSLLTAHPRFLGYVVGSAAPAGTLAELLAAAVNPNSGAWLLSPMASEIEAQTIRWIAELIGYPASCGGLLVSGGTMANFVGILAARKARATWNIRAGGLRAGAGQLVLYTSSDTHTWVQKAADLFGLGTGAIRWIPVDAARQMDVGALEQQILSDRADGYVPFLVAASAGTVGTGAIDPLPEIAAVCRAHGLWFHVDGAYGAPAAALPEAPASLRGMAEADSVALDPHKWLYSPLEAGCALVRDPQHLVDAFSFHPEYYNFAVAGEEPAINYYELGPQNSRGFRALKVWLGLRQAGRAGYVQMIREDIALAQALYRNLGAYPELQPATQSLSITTFRFAPADLPLLREADPAAVEAYLNDLNRELLTRLQGSGEAFVSNAVVDGRYLLRACITNFRTTLADVEALPEIVVRLGRACDAELRPPHLRQ